MNIQKEFKALEEQLKKLNDNRIFHSDIHAGNIMWDIDNECLKLIDFGEAKIGVDQWERHDRIDLKSVKEAMKYSQKLLIRDFQNFCVNKGVVARIG